MATTVNDLIDDIREKADMQLAPGADPTVQFVSNPEIAKRATESVSELFDLMEANDKSYFLAPPYTFTLSSTLSGNSINVQNLPGGCYRIFQLFWTQMTVPVLVPRGASAERYRCNGRRQHFYYGDNLEVQPFQVASGPYSLLYVPYPPTLALPTVLTVNAGVDAVNASTGVWTFTNAAFNQALVGATLITSGSANNGNNGSFTIVAVPSNLTIQTVPTGLTTETFGSTFSAQTQPVGTMYTIPQKLEIWKEFITTSAALYLKDKEEGDVSFLTATKQRLIDRIEGMAGSRDSESPVIGIVNGWGNGDGGDWGY